MKKDVVQIEGFELISRSYARKFSAKLKKEEFYLREYLSEAPDNSMSLMMDAYLKSYASAQEIKDLESKIKKWKKANPAE